MSQNEIRFSGGHRSRGRQYHDKHRQLVSQDSKSINQTHKETLDQSETLLFRRLNLRLEEDRICTELSHEKGVESKDFSKEIDALMSLFKVRVRLPQRVVTGITFKGKLGSDFDGWLPSYVRHEEVHGNVLAV